MQISFSGDDEYDDEDDSFSTLASSFQVQSAFFPILLPPTFSAQKLTKGMLLLLCTTHPVGHSFIGQGKQ